MRTRDQTLVPVLWCFTNWVCFYSRGTTETSKTAVGTRHQNLPWNLTGTPPPPPPPPLPELLYSPTPRTLRQTT